MSQSSKNFFPDTVITKNAIIEFKRPTAKAGDAATAPPARGIDEMESSEVGGKKALNWGDDNDFPQVADETIEGNTVLKRSLKMRCDVIMGQGIMPVKITGFNPDGSEVFEVVDDAELIALLQRNWVTRYLTEATRDLERHGNAWVQFRPNLDGSGFLKLNVTNALHCRLEFPDNLGICKRVLLNGKWPDGDKVNAYQLLSEYDATEEFELLEDFSQPIFYQLKNSFSSNPYYCMPNWYVAKNQRWIDISNKTAQVIEAGLDNYASSFLHIQIPYEYWEKKYPPDDYKDLTEWRKKVEADVKKLEESLTTAENARTALTTHFSSEENAIDKWDISVKEFKINTEALQNNSAADTQIAIAAGLQPDILGLMFGNSKGGSMQREILLLLYALAWADRERLLEPLELFLKHKNAKWADVQLRFRQTFLTTLDSGGGTSKNLG